MIETQQLTGQDIYVSIHVNRCFLLTVKSDRCVQQFT